MDVKYFKFLILSFFLLKSFFTYGHVLLTSVTKLVFNLRSLSNALTILLCAKHRMIHPVPITPVPTMEQAAKEIVELVKKK